MVSDKILNILLSKSEELKIDSSNFFAQNIPQDLISTDKTMILITEIHSIFTNRASDVSTAKDNMIEIQIFYRGDTEPDRTESIINQELEKHRFYQINSYPDVDSDTGYLTRTMKYENTEVIY